MQYTSQGGEFDGCIQCNEMLLFKLPIETFNDLMTIYHHDMPMEQESSIRERIEQQIPLDSNGRALGTVEGFDNFGRPVGRTPSFIS